MTTGQCIFCLSLLSFPQINTICKTIRPAVSSANFCANTSVQRISYVKPLFRLKVQIVLVS